jgi:DNA-binding CsgD family transcriptional regulator
MTRQTKVSQAVELVRNGSSYAEAARATDAQWSNVRKACLLAGVEQSPRAAYRASQASVLNYKSGKSVTGKLVVKLVSAGMSYGEVAAQLGISRERVAGYVFRNRRAKAKETA